MSLPSRERGLKLAIVSLNLANMMSLPSRERGLKSCLYKKFWHKFSVAPLAGAWIEIYKMQLYLTAKIVAPLAGAWIEIVVWYI